MCVCVCVCEREREDISSRSCRRLKNRNPFFLSIALQCHHHRNDSERSNQTIGKNFTGIRDGRYFNELMNTVYYRE